MGFSLLYLVMLAGYIAYIVRTMRIGPECDHPDRAGQPRPVAGPAPAPGVFAAELAGGR